MENTKKLTFLDESQTIITSTSTAESHIEQIEFMIDAINIRIANHEEIWHENKAAQIGFHAHSLKKLIRESAIVPSENQESIK